MWTHKQLKLNVQTHTNTNTKGEFLYFSLSFWGLISFIQMLGLSYPSMLYALFLVDSRLFVCARLCVCRVIAAQRKRLRGHTQESLTAVSGSIFPLPPFFPLTPPIPPPSFPSIFCLSKIPPISVSPWKSLFFCIVLNNLDFYLTPSYIPSPSLFFTRTLICSSHLP